MGTIGSRVFCLSYCSLRSKRESNSRPSRLIAWTLSRSNAHLHHTGNLCGGNRRPEPFAIALPVELQRPSSLAGLEPATAGVDGTRAFTTPQTFQKFFFPTDSLILLGAQPAFFMKCCAPANSRTPVASSRPLRFVPPKSAPKKLSGRNQRSRLSGLEPEPFGLSERSTRELHHPGRLILR